MPEFDATAHVHGVVAWCKATLTELEGDYAFIPAGKTKSLPDVVADVGTIETTVDDPRFPFQSIQQRFLAVYAVSLSIMVDNTDEEAAADLLRDMAQRLATSLLRTGGNLGGRVPFVSPFFTFDFTRPFVRYQDGTKGRELTMDVAVGELVEETKA